MVMLIVSRRLSSQGGEALVYVQLPIESRETILRVENATRFDDVDREMGYEYRGFNYVIRSEMDRFIVRTYDDEPGKATVVKPTSMSTNCHLRVLVDFLQSELGAVSIWLYNGDTGSYAEIDLDGLRFAK